MQFNSINFMIFFPIVLLGYFFVPKSMRRVWLLIASYFFYMSWNAKYAVLIAFSTLVTYFSGRLIDYCGREGIKKSILKRLVLVGCLVINIGILAIFKYGNFLINSIDRFLSLFHFQTNSGRLDLLLPVGISFYTFQALGYIIDVYRGDVECERNIITYALFVSFFPQLVAGPIERSGHLLIQMKNVADINILNMNRIKSGAILMIWGYFMKMMIADRVAILVNTVFEDFTAYGSVELILAMFGFTLQIYCDFASYSMIAIGAAKTMGFDLMENFNTPYLSQSMHEFWNRWHISLSSWFRDYLYIPLGGNRKGTIRKYINLMVVFLISGLWHGAAWNFVVWGGLHGIYQVIENVTINLRKSLLSGLKIKTQCFSWRLLRVLIIFVFVSLAWVFFRSTSVHGAFLYIYRMMSVQDPWILFNGGLYELGLDRTEMNILIISTFLLVLVDLLKYKLDMTIDAFLMKQNTWFEWGCIIVLILTIYVYGIYGRAYDPQQFIYFQF